MQKNNHLRLIQALSVLASLVGLSSVIIIPVISQAQSNPGAPAPIPDRPGNITPDSPNTDPNTSAPTPSSTPGMGNPGMGMPGMGNPSPGETPRPDRPGNITPDSPNRDPQTPGTGTPSPSPSPTRPAPAPTPGGSASGSLGELLQQASSAGSYRTLARIVQETGVGGTLRSRGGDYTILAPTDEAFSRLPAGTLDRLLRPENRALLGRILAYHVIPGEITSSQMRTGGVETLGGGISVRVNSGRVIVNDGSVVQPDIQASNGVVHGISTVLMSRELRQQVTSLR
jgi:uncharacterized surface protein with fasciclin (FAS1) repeats